MRHLPLLVLIVPLFVGSSAHAADAEALWTKKCAGCHGADGKAQTRVGRKYDVADFTTPAFQSKTTDAHLRTVIEDGVKDTKMPSFKSKLTPEEISVLVAYIRHFKK